MNNKINDASKKIKDLINKTGLVREDYESLTEALNEICFLNTRCNIASALNFAKGRINEIKQYPDLVRCLAQFTLSRFQSKKSEDLKLWDEFSSHKDLASVIYSYLITDMPRCDYNSKNYIRRHMVLDLFSDTPRGKGVIKNLQQLGVKNEDIDAYEAGLLEDLDHLMAPRDSELSSLIYGNKELLDAVMCMSEFKRQRMIKSMLEDLDKVTLSEKHFPNMAKLLLILIDNQISGAFAPYMDELYRSAVVGITKMGAKPGYQKSQILIQQIEDLARDRAEHFNVESCFYAAIGTNFSKTLTENLKNSPANNLLKSSSEKDIIAALGRMKSCKAPLYRLIEAFELRISEKYLNKIKRDSLMRDLNM